MIYDCYLVDVVIDTLSVSYYRFHCYDYLIGYLKPDEEQSLLFPVLFDDNQNFHRWSAQNLLEARCINLMKNE